MQYHAEGEQNYYRSCIPNLPGSLSGLEWKFSGFNKWFKKKTQKTAEFRPDGFYADEEDEIVAILEVVDTNDISEVKASRLAWAAWELDEIGWEMIVVLHYPKQKQTLLRERMIYTDVEAETKFSSEKYPFRASFRSQLEAA